MDIQVRTAWQKSDPELKRDARGFWRGLNVMHQSEMDARVDQLVAVAYDRDAVLGVSTARPTEYKALRARFFFYRSVVRPDDRHETAAEHLVSASKDILGRWGRENPDEKMKGLLIEFEGKHIQKLYSEPVVRRMDFELLLAGYTDEGHQIRVLWFDDARLEP